MKKILEKSIAGLLALVLMVSCAWMLPKDVSASSNETVYEDTGVVYAQHGKSYAQQYFGNNNMVPEFSAKTGLLYGGWYTKVVENGVSKFKPIKNQSEFNKAQNFYSKHVPAYVLSVRCQNSLGTNAASSNTMMRYIAGLDSTNYAEVGFIVHGVSFDGTYDNSTMKYTNTEKNIKQVRHAGTNSVTTIYRNVYVYKTNNAGETEGFKRPASVVFGDAAKYMMTYRLKVSKMNFGRTYAIQPYWKTFDGVVVKGLTKYAHVEDGINGYINVPVNLNDGCELSNRTGVAAGKLTVDFTELAKNGYTFMEAECGTVFPEKVVKKDGNTIQCVATVANGHGTESPVGNKASDNIYINLRFERTGSTGNAYNNRYFVNLPVSNVQFAKITYNGNNPTGEALVDGYKVWDVRF